jgi:hypothetical protein
LQAGQNPFLVLSQQGSQVASIFGPGGAVAGAFIAIAGIIGMNLAPALFRAKQGLEGLENAQDNLNGILDTTVEKVSAVSTEYSKMMRFSQGLARIEAIVAQQEALQALKEAQDEVVESVEGAAMGMWRDWGLNALSTTLNDVSRDYGVLQKAIASPNAMATQANSFGRTVSTLNDLQSAFGISREAAGDLVEVLAKFKTARTPQEFADLTDQLYNVVDSAGQMDAETLSLFKQMGRLAYQSANTIELMEKLEDVQTRIAEGKPIKTGEEIKDAADKTENAISTFEKLRRSLDSNYNASKNLDANLNVISASTVSVSEKTRLAGLAYSAWFDVINKVDEKTKENNKTLDIAKSSVEKYQDSIKDLASSIDNASMGAIQGMENALVDLVSGTSSVEDAFRNMASSIIKDLIRIQMQQSIMGPLSGLLSQGMNAAVGYMTGNQYITDGGGMPLADGSGNNWDAFGSNIFAGGGYTGMGARSGGIDGKGGFPAILHPNETVVDHAQGQSLGEGVTIVQNINVTTGVQQTVRAEIMGLMPQIANASKAAVLDARKRGGSYAGAF